MIHGKMGKRTGLIRSSTGMPPWIMSFKDDLEAALKGLAGMPAPEKEQSQPQIRLG